MRKIILSKKGATNFNFNSSKKEKFLSNLFLNFTIPLIKKERILVPFVFEFHISYHFYKSYLQQIIFTPDLIKQNK
ncbi:hypothetical protein BpHYR1_022624 [Brachionus plicatilis]|uniref:Uncharacterized protein n=1 Tax=Brachionus plicatilis TaxID=10195 RepID=A0A3M7RY30_BRAPC|nr:hypothetical protein BpHYR1_022624 [Brachionus plicatilis]